MRLFPRKHAAYLVSMHELASQAYERAQSDKARLKVIGMVLGLMEREVKLLGLDSEMRNHVERRGGPDDRGTVLICARGLSPQRGNAEADPGTPPIEKPDHAKSSGGPGPIDG